MYTAREACTLYARSITNIFPSKDPVGTLDYECIFLFILFIAAIDRQKVNVLFSW